MKVSKIISGLILSLTLVSGQAFSVEVRIGLIDAQVLSSESMYGKDFMKKLESEFNPRREKLEGKEKELRLKYEALNRDKDILPEKERVAKERELTTLQQELHSMGEDFKTDVASRQEKFGKAYDAILQNVLQDIAQQEKLDLIIPNTVVMYNTGKSDYTYQVLKAMDKKYSEPASSKS